MKRLVLILVLVACVAVPAAFADSVTIVPGQTATFNYTSIYNSTSTATATISLLALGAPLPSWVIPPSGGSVNPAGSWIKITLANTSTDFASGCATPGSACYVANTGTRLDAFGLNSTPNLSSLVQNIYFGSGTSCLNPNSIGCTGWAVGWSVTASGGSLSHLEFSLGDANGNFKQDLTHGEVGVAYIQLNTALSSFTLDPNGVGQGTNVNGSNGNVCGGVGGLTAVNPNNACDSITGVHMKNINNTGQSDKPGGQNEVPEPASLALLGTGLVAGGSFLRKRFGI